MGDVAIPWDKDAEEIVAAFVVGDMESALAASKVLDGTDFYDRRLGRIFSIAVQLTAISAEDDRVHAVAELADVDFEWLVSFTDNRPARRDRTGAYARSVREKARRRRVMGIAAQLYNGASRAETATLSQMAAAISQEVTALVTERSSVVASSSSAGI
ncbi:MAG: hypothetical protein ABSB09_00855 [Acidimicrobiales bacterium]